MSRSERAAMTTEDVIALLEKNKNERGIAHWARLYPNSKKKSFGIGLTQLRKLAKQVGRNHDLAVALWKSDVYDAKVVGVLVDEPAKMTRAQAESQVGELGTWMFAHVYCSCDAPLSKTSFVRKLAVDWATQKDAVRRRCGYLLLAELAKDRKDLALTDAFFASYLDCIAKAIPSEENFVKDAMNNAVFAIGQRSAQLNRKAIAVARGYGPLHVDYGDNSCEPMDVLKHLTGDRIKKALA